MTTTTWPDKFNLFAKYQTTTLEREPIDAKSVIQAVAPPTLNSSTASSSYSPKGTDTITIGDQQWWFLTKNAVTSLLNPARLLMGSQSPLVSLRKAVDNNSQLDFLEVIAYIDFRESPRMLKEAIDLALEANWYSLAVQLAQDAGRLFPDDTLMQKYARVLSPPRVINNQVPTPAGISEAREWVRNNGADYRGLWVAIQYGQLVGSAAKRAQLKEIVGALPSPDGLIMMKIPGVVVNF